MNDNLLVGLRDGTIKVQPCSGGDAKTIMQSHSEGEVWGLEMWKGKVLTSGDDNAFGGWDPVKRCRIGVHKVSSTNKKAKRGGASSLSNLPASQQSRSITVGPDNMALAANDGSVYIFKHGSYDSPIKTLSDSDEWIEVMAYSPDGSMLAVGSHDNRIYVYNTSDFSLKGTCKGHSSYIMALDWS